MLRWAFRMARLQRTGNLVVAALGPLIQNSRQRLRGIPDTAWLDPYMLGFMAMLITTLARTEQRSLSEADLAFIQAQAWSGLTDMDADLFGREVMLLAEAHDEQFYRGCSDAESVAQSLILRRISERFDTLSSEAEEVPAAWETTFDLRMASISAAWPAAS